jgi:hypothetical protein
VSDAFQLDDVAADLASVIPELAVGPWRCAPAGLVAFAAGELPAPRWRIALGRDLDTSHRALAGGERSVADTHARLDDVPDRLDRAIDHALGDALGDALGGAAQAPRTTRALASFAAPTAEAGLIAALEPDRRARSADRVTADARLIAALVGDTAALDPARLAWSADAAPAASTEPEPEPEPGRLGSLLERIADLARGRSRIETHVEGALIAHSVTTLSGDTELWIAPRLSLTGARLHARSVAVAVRTRHAWARILTLVVRGASRLAAFGLPAGAVSALPVVWRFVRDVLRELRHRDTALRAPA